MKNVFLTLVLCGCINYLFAQNQGNQCQQSPYEIGIQNAIENGEIVNNMYGLQRINDKSYQYHKTELQTIPSLYIEIGNKPPKIQNHNSYLVRYKFKASQIDKFLEKKGNKITDVKVEKLENNRYNLYYRKAKKKKN